MFDTSEPVTQAKGRIIYKAVFEIGVFKEITLLPCAISVALNLFLPWISNSCKLFTVVRIVVNCLCVGLMLYYCFVSMCLWENILERSRQNKEETKNSHKLDLNHIDQCCFSEVTLHDDRKKSSLSTSTSWAVTEMFFFNILNIIAAYQVFYFSLVGTIIPSQQTDTWEKPAPEMSIQYKV